MGPEQRLIKDARVVRQTHDGWLVFWFIAAALVLPIMIMLAAVIASR